MNGTVLPYLVADAGSVVHSGWERRAGEGWEDLGDSLPDWDYSTDLRLRATVAVDRARFLEETGLDGGVALRCVVAYRATDGKVGEVAIAWDLTLDHLAEATLLEVLLPGPHLGPVVEIRTRLVLAEAHEPAPPGVATLPGSVLWAHSVTVALAGDLARFPIAVIDFVAAGLDNDASWVLDIPDDLNSPLLGGLLLLLNRRDATLITAVDRDPDGLLVTELKEGVAVTMLDHAVAHADELAEGSWDEGSLGENLGLLTRRHDGGLSGLVTLREARPAAYRAALVGIAKRSGLGRRFE